MKDKYTISVLLTKQNDVISKLLYYITGRGYTHASIGFDGKQEEFYSFNFKGFRREHPKKHRHLITESVCFNLDVTKEQYENVVNLIYEFQEKRKVWKYSIVGVICCILQIPYKKKWHYFCSQFVAEILEKSKVTKLQKNASLYLPNALIYILDEHCAIKNVLINAI